MPPGSPSAKNTILPFASAMVALVSAAVFLVSLVQQESGRCFSKTVSLERGLEKARPSGEFGYGVTLPKGFRDDPRMAEQAIVLEDGKPLPLRIEKIKHVGDKGRGRYRITQRVAYISTPDNSDPTTNGRTYELQAPRKVRPLALWLPLCLLTGAMFCLQRCGVPTLRMNWQLKPWVEPVLVLGISFAAMLWALNHFADYSDGWLIVNGLPYSDGMGWLELGKSLSEGRGFNGAFEAHRGGYPILLGSFFSLIGGGSVMAAKFFNALMLSIGSTAIYCLVQSAFGRVLAIITLAGLLLGTRFGEIAQMTLTEPAGFALAAIGLHQLHRACSKPAVWRFVLVGVFLGLSNLVRPFTLLALPIFGALILWLAWRGRWGWRRFAMIGVAYVGGAMLIFGPWVLRQKMTWGVATLDLNGAVMLYGAAVPPGEGEKQTLSARHYFEGDDAGFARDDYGPRYHFYMRRYKESVGADRGAYFKTVAGKFVEFFSMPGFGDGHLRSQLGALFFVTLVWLAWRRRIPPLIMLAGLWPLIADGLQAVPALVVVVAGAVIGFCCLRGAARLAIVILWMTLFGAGILNALVGNFALNRGAVFIEWMVFLSAAAGIVGLAHLAGARDQSSEVDPDRPLPVPRDRFGDVYPIAMLGVFALGFFLVLAKSVLAGKPEADAALWTLPPTVSQQARLAVLQHDPQSKLEAEDLYISRVRLGEYRWFIPAEADLGHWARPFEVRPFNRTMATPLTGYDAKSHLAQSITVNLRGDQRELDGERDYVLVGLRNVDESAELGVAATVVEALALIPYSLADETLGEDGTLYFAMPPDLR